MFPIKHRFLYKMCFTKHTQHITAKIVRAASFEAAFIIFLKYHIEHALRTSPSSRSSYL